MNLCKKLVPFAMALCMVFGATACGHEHVFEGEWTLVSEPTCTEEGIEERTCTCGEKEIQSIPAIGHEETLHAGKPVTCTESGWGLYSTCSRCGYSSLTETPPLGHKIYKYETRAASCTTRGWNAYQTCMRCDYTTRAAAIPATGHNYVNGKCTSCQKVISEGLKYELDEDNNYWVAGFGTFEGPDLVIPDTYNERPVVGICPNAFYVTGNAEEIIKKSLIQTVDIPGSVKVIGQNAFAFNVKLNFLLLGEGIEVIEESAFYGCMNLRSLEIPDSTYAIFDLAFKDCISLKILSVGTGLTILADNTFRDCTAIAEITYWDRIEQWKTLTGGYSIFDSKPTVHCLDGDWK